MITFVYLGVPAAGLVLVPVNTRLAAPEMRADAQLARPRNVSSLRYLIHGASPIAAETLRRAQKAFSEAELLHIYGTTAGQGHDHQRRREYLLHRGGGRSVRASVR